MVFSAPLAIGFGVLGALSARSKNKALAKFAKQGQEQINKQITEVRVQTLDSLLRASQEAQVLVGRARAGLAGTSGLSSSQIIATIAGDVTADSIVRHRNRDSMLDALDAQKDQIIAQAQGQMTSPGMAAISAGLGGFELGQSIDGSIAAVGRQREMLKIDQALVNMSEAGNTLDRTRSLMLRGYAERFLESAAGRLRYLLDDIDSLRSSVRSLEGQ